MWRVERHKTEKRWRKAVMGESWQKSPENTVAIEKVQ